MKYQNDLKFRRWIADAQVTQIGKKGIGASKEIHLGAKIRLGPSVGFLPCVLRDLRVELLFQADSVAVKPVTNRK